MNNGRLKILPWLLIAVQLALLVFFAFNRLVDGDEGFYLSAAREVAEGHTLYADFFYPQMPYLPYIFSVFAGHGFTTLYMTRLASVLAALLTTILFYLALRKLVTDRATVNILLFLYVFSGSVIAWHSTAKTFAWTDLFLMAAFYFLVWFMRFPRWWQLSLIGVALALAVNTRLVLAPLVLVFYLPMVANSGRRWFNRTLAYVIPMVIVSLPSLKYLINDTKRFMFDNLGFHFMRNPGVEFPQSFYQKLEVIGKILINPQFLIIIILAAIAFWSWKRIGTGRGWRNFLVSPRNVAGITALVLAIVYILPNPTHQQYYVQVIPFVLMASSRGLSSFIESLKSKKSVTSLRKTAAAVAIIYLLGITPYFVVYIGAIRDCDGHTNLDNLRRISDTLNNHGEDGPILAELPLVSVLANKEPVGGVEFLGFEYPLPLDKGEMRYYRLALNEDLERILTQKEVSYYVVVNQPPEELANATEANYELEGTYERFRIYRRKL